jgi:hypothetical protein
MGKTNIAVKGITIFAAALLALSCASPMRLTDDWKDSSFTGPAYKKLMVVALTKRADLRQPLEDEFARQLKARGIEASTCYECIPDPDKVNREELTKASQGMGIEAFLIVRVLRVETNVQSYRASSPSPAGPSIGMDSMRNMQWGAPDPPMTKRSEVATLESRLFDGKTSNLVWRSTADAVNPSGSKEEISRFVGLVLKTLSGEKLIPPQKP